MTVMKIEVQNTDLIVSDYSRVAILDYENVIITAPKYILMEEYKMMK